MRTHGTLSKWNEERGFGFITLSQGDAEVFVHVSAFPRDGVRPRAGEMISFDLQEGPDGKRRAVNVMRPGGRRSVAAGRNDRENANRSALSTLLSILAIGAIGAYACQAYTSRHGHAAWPRVSPPAPMQASSGTSQSFTCDGRTHCSQMTSCAEAIYFLRHCPNTQMDGNNDGEPCEQQWCN